MNLLRKMLCILVITVFAGNAEGLTTLDLPNDTPGLQIGNTRNKTINNIPNQECAHIIIPNTPASQARDVVVQAMNREGNIYFPVDGTQPTAEEAVEYSCANVDAHNEDSPITEWYMQMFGVIPFRNINTPGEGDYVKAGWNDTGAFCKVIDISNLLTSDDNDLPKKYQSQQDAFVQNFRRIASTSVGRVLLYRILLEIRRTKNGTGAQEGGTKTPLPPDISKRNKVHHILIKWSTIGNNFHPNGNINFGVYSPFLRATTISKNTELVDGKIIYKILNYPKTDDVGLFHEMIHWYHYLRDIKRVNIEGTGHNGNVNLHGINVARSRNVEIYFANHYWPNSSSVDWKGSALPWVCKYNDYLVVNFEEIRTILGVPNNCSDYKNGDDLSENLYRSCVGQPLRFGHSRSSFFEDDTVISLVKQVVRQNISIYNIKDIYFIEKEDDGVSPIFEYRNERLVRGINGCKVPVLGVDCVK